MADNIGVKAGTDSTVWTDEVSGPKHAQVVKLADGTADSVSVIPGHATRGLRVDPYRDIQRIIVTPVVSSGVAYTAGDVVGGILQFPNAVRAAGGAGQILSATIINKANSTHVGSQLAFFDRTFTHPGDNAPWNPSDADMLNWLGSLGLIEDGRIVAGTWTNNIPSARPFYTNTVGHGLPLLPYVLNGTDLFAAMVTGATPNLGSTSDIQVALIVERF